MFRSGRFLLYWFCLTVVGLMGLLAPAGLAQTAPLLQITETPTNTPVPAFTIFTVQPNPISNGLDTEIVVTGNGFLNGAQVVLDGFGGLNTTFVSANLLRAVVPAGTPANTYTVRVINADAQQAALASALTITSVTSTPMPTSTPASTAFVRPIIVVNSYGASSAEVVPNTNLAFEMTFANAGQIEARNVIATFKTGDFIPRDTGGIHAAGNIPAGQTHRFWQPLFATADLRSKPIAVLEVAVSYTDVNGNAFTETFNLTFTVYKAPAGVAGPTATPTPTQTPTPTATYAPRLRPQLIITGYETDIAQLEPGLRFRLTLHVNNQGNANAQRVTMILGGGSISGGGSGSTPEPGGGVTGGGGDFSNFAPVSGSNIQFVGDMVIDERKTITQDIIVNATTKPGAYPMKVSFVYNDLANGNFVDDQVITLLVYQKPQANMDFYMELPMFTVGEFGSLPLQLTNTGRNSTIFGNFRVTATGATLMGGSVFVGTLEPGGYFPLDAQIIPEQAGTLELLLEVEYNDDFNQPQVLTKTVSIEVMEAMIIEPPIDGGLDGGGEIPPIDPEPLPPAEETWAEWGWRLFLGLLGWDSSRPEPETGFEGGFGEPTFPEGEPIFEEQFVPMPGG